MEKTKEKSAKMNRRLSPLRTFAEANGFTMGQVRWWIFQGKESGFAGCCRKIGRNIFVDLDRAEEWVDNLNIGCR